MKYNSWYRWSWYDSWMYMIEMTTWSHAERLDIDIIWNDDYYRNVMNAWQWRNYMIIRWYYDWHDVHVKGSHRRNMWYYLLYADSPHWAIELTPQQFVVSVWGNRYQRLTQMDRLSPKPLVLSTLRNYWRPRVKYKSHLWILCIFIWFFSNEWDSVCVYKGICFMYVW